MSDNEVLKAKDTPNKIGSSCWALTCAGFIIMVMSAIAGPKLIGARSSGNEAAAIGSLKSIENAQRLHREKGSASYADLQTLGGAKLIDEVLASGAKQGFAFECQASTAHPSSAWAATAFPTVPGTTGDRHFAINHTGVIYWSKAPIVMDPKTCEAPPETKVLGL
jgi:hypothetical protein